MHNANGKRWLLIGLLVLGGFWLVNDAYDDGYRDALVQSGQTQTVRHYRGGPHFPWGLVILGGIGYIAWRKGAFDRFGGPGGPFGNGSNHGERGMQVYGTGNGPAQTPGAAAFGQGGSPVFRGPRAFFEDGTGRRTRRPPARNIQRLPLPGAAGRAPNFGRGAPQGASRRPAADPARARILGIDGWRGRGDRYLRRAVTPPAAPDARQDEQPDAPRGATGTAV